MAALPLKVESSYLLGHGFSTWVIATVSKEPKEA